MANDVLDIMTADDVLLLAKALHALADSCEHSAKIMDDLHTTQINVTNRATGQRGLVYVKNWVEGIGAALTMSDATAAINKLMAGEKRLKVAEKRAKFKKTSGPP